MSKVKHEIEKGPRRVFRDFEVLSWYKDLHGGGSAAPGAYDDDADYGYYWNQGGGAGKTTYLAPKCVHKGRRVFSLTPEGGQKVTIWAVQSSQIRHIAKELDLWIPLNVPYSTSSDFRGFVTGTAPRGEGPFAKLWNRLAKIDAPKETLQLDWPDQGIPPVSAGVFWPELIKGLFSMAEAKKGELHVAFSCVGSHGRTGTALACVLALVSNTNDGAALVQAVRQLHCKEAVESKIQVEYIDAIAKGLEKFSGVQVTLYPLPADPAPAAAEPQGGK